MTQTVTANVSSNSDRQPLISFSVESTTKSALASLKKIAPIYENPSIHDQVLLALNDPGIFLKFVNQIPFFAERAKDNPTFKLHYCISLYQSKSCSNPDACDRAHSLYEKMRYALQANPHYKTKICRHRTEDMCPFRDACYFVHEGDLFRVFKSPTEFFGFAMLGAGNQMSAIVPGNPLPLKKNEENTPIVSKASATKPKEEEKQAKKEDSSEVVSDSSTKGSRGKSARKESLSQNEKLVLGRH